MVVISEQGKFLLKRRPRGKDDLYRVAFAHAVQAHLAARAFPVTSLLATRDEHNTILQLDHHIYEFFEFVSGVRYDGSPEATTDAGRLLASFHRHLADLPSAPTHQARIACMGIPGPTPSPSPARNCPPPPKR
ncbi:MAG: phosphotransferase [Planctomycetota bacterium]